MVTCPSEASALICRTCAAVTILAHSATVLQVDTKPASDIIAGAVARAASQGTIHPLDTLKVRMQAQGGLKGPLSKIGKLVPPAGGHPGTGFDIPSQAMHNLSPV